jgi:GAF domain-containing protein
MQFRSNEEERLAALHALGVLDSPEDPAFDAIVREAAAALNVPIALVSLVDENRQWFKARVGLEPQETSRSVSFCSHAIQSSGPMSVSDASKDERFADNPLVLGDPHIRFYAGIPLTTQTGWRVGTLCVIDKAPRQGLTDDQVATLERLADRVMELMELRKGRS